MSILTLNIKSIRNKIKEFEVFLENCNKPDLILLTEHWLKNWEPFHLPNYYIVSKYCRETSDGYGGTIILIKRSFSLNFHLEEVDKYDFLRMEKEFEFSIAFNKKHNLYLICIYRPPRTNATGFLVNLETILLDLPVNCRVILSGDLNINFINNISPATLALKNLLRSYGLSMYINSPTRVTEESSTVIDYFCTNLVENKVNCDIVSTPGLSDHEALLASFSLLCTKQKIPHRYGRVFSSENFNKFSDSCSLVDWECVLTSGQPLETFHMVLHNTFTKSFPLRSMRAKKPKKNWITKGIKTSSRNLKSLHFIRKFTNSQYFINYYGDYRRVYRRVIKAAKLQYYQNRISNAKNPSKEAWSIVNDLRGKHSYTEKSADLQPNILNEFYCSIAKKISDKMEPSLDPLSYLNLNHSHIDETFALTETTVEELVIIIRDIKNKNSAGIDEMSVKIFQNLNNNILFVLSQAINKCFEIGEFPDSLKVALVIPIHKTGSFKNPANFRPISLLNTLSKIVEKVVKNRLTVFLSRNNIISDCQFGFQSSKSTSDAVFCFLEQLYLKLNGGEVAAAVFCDLSKAFDCVKHEVLLKKMHIYGIRDTSLNFFNSYVSRRTQMVKNNNSISSALAIDTGVPQGSVLGPILFLVYINDLFKLPLECVFTGFADDITPLWHHKDPQILKDIVSNDLHQIKVWCDSNFLSFNTEKTKVLSFKFSFDNLRLGDRSVGLSEDTKFLGINIDCNLNFFQHIVNLNKKIAAGGYAVRQTCYELGQSMAKTTYFALVESHLRYGIAFWGNCSQRLFQSVFTLQKRCVRYIFGAGLRDHCRPLFQRGKMLTLVDLFILETVCLVHKRYQGTTHTHSYPTRNYNLIPLPIPRFSLTRNSLIYKSIKMYNKLPLNLRTNQGYKSFRHGVKCLLADKAYYSLDEYLEDNF